MKQVVIENPVLNSPFEEPGKRFRFSDEGVTNSIKTKYGKSSMAN